MRPQALFFLVLILVSQSFITYDSGQVVNKDGTNNFYCNNANNIQTYQFSGEFEKKPQVFLSLEYIDSTYTSVTISFEILSITTTNFQAKLNCKANQVWRFYYNWWAIDDTRVQVINFFDSTSFGQQSIPHTNCNLVKGFPSLFSMSYSSGFSVDITIDEITSTTVKYTITKSGGLVNIGYSIVLVTEESYSFIERQSITADYTSPLQNLKPNYWLVVPYVGFNTLSQTKQIREYKSYTTTSTTVQYQLLQHQTDKCPNTFLAAWLTYIFSKQFLPIEVQKVNSALYYDNNQPFNSIRIIELNKYYTSFGTNSLIIDKSVNTLNIEVLNTCDIGKKYISKFNFCNSCSGSYQTKQLTNACLNMQNILAYRIRLKQAVADYKELIFIQSNTGVQIKQVLYNQKITEMVIVNIQQNDQCDNKFLNQFLIFKIQSTFEQIFFNNPKTFNFNFFSKKNQIEFLYFQNLQNQPIILQVEQVPQYISFYQIIFKVIFHQQQIPFINTFNLFLIQMQVRKIKKNEYVIISTQQHISA